MFFSITFQFFSVKMKLSWCCIQFTIMHNYFVLVHHIKTPYIIGLSKLRQEMRPVSGPKHVLHHYRSMRGIPDKNPARSESIAVYQTLIITRQESTFLLFLPVLLFLPKCDSFEQLWLCVHVIYWLKNKLRGEQAGTTVLLLANIVVYSGCHSAITQNNTMTKWKSRSRDPKLKIPCERLGKANANVCGICRL